MFLDNPPRLFGLPPGADFPEALVAGLAERLAGQPPEAWARVRIYVNTRRMARAVAAVFDTGPPRLLPRIRLVTDIGLEANGLPPPVSALGRRLELARLVAALLDREPQLAPRTALFDLADSLAELMDEMQSAGVTPEALDGIDMGGHAAHWAHNRRFIELVARYFGEAAGEAPDTEARQRLSVERLMARWRTSPPADPVLVAGSTGSREATARLMAAVARLPQGAVVLPGFDFNQPAAVWETLDAHPASEDHPQYRFRALMRRLGVGPAAVAPWQTGAAPAPARNRLLSLALRPAPVTDQWMAEGPRLRDLAAATTEVTLIEAAGPRAEATAIALRLRQAAEDGVTAALVTPDRMLTRQVTAALDRWGIVPDDSAGTPLALSAPGRFLRQVAALFAAPLTSEALLALLKHPLANTGGAERGAHLRLTRELELDIRRHGPAFPTSASLLAWAGRREEEGGRTAWAAWLARQLDGLTETGSLPLEAHVTRHVALAEALAGGPGGGDGELWQKAAGAEARAACDELGREAPHGGAMSPADYAALFRGVLDRREVREPVQPHPGVKIWGTLEARAMGADLAILAGLNEGVWPPAAEPDPWLNREMRHTVGLSLPERRIGLSAHDFQQAAGARRVVLSRAVRDEEAETVPARWVNRLTNLLGGLEEAGGIKALAAMRARGGVWLARAAALERPAEAVAPAPRPAPRPPVAERPGKLPVTGVRTLIRDPYAIYARYVLGLRPLDPLAKDPDALLRGTVLHEVLERFLREGPEPDAADAAPRLMALADTVLADRAPWPAARQLWRARLERVADWFLRCELVRRERGAWLAAEETGAVRLARSAFTLTAKPDRIDRLSSGELVVYDYKTGTPPTARQMEHFDKQLLLEAAMAGRGAFTGQATPVAEAVYIGLGTEPVERAAPLAEDGAGQAWAGLEALIAAYGVRGQGYTSRAAMEKRGEAGDYDQLARFREWDETTAATPREVGG